MFFNKNIVTIIVVLAAVQPGIAQHINYNDTFTLYHPDFVMRKSEGAGDTMKNVVFLKGRYKDSVPDGRWEFYDFQGKIYEIHQYKNGLLNDTFYKKSDTILLEKGCYKNNLKTGPWKDSYETFTYVNDTLQGWKKSSYYGAYYVDGKATGPYYKQDHRSKDTVVRGQYVNNSREGKWTIWGDHNLENAILNFKNNELEDTCYYFWRDSTLHEKTTYRNGKKHGPEYYYGGTSEGDIYSCKYCIVKTEYKNNSADGEKIVTTPKGDTLLQAMYKQGSETGVKVIKNMKGQVREKHWRNGAYDSCLKWDDAGRLRQQNVDRGWRAIHGEFTKRWDAAGKLEFADSFYTQGNSRMIDVYEYTNGILMGEKHFTEGKRDGRCYKKGVYDLQYSNGELVKRVSGKGMPDDYNEDDIWYMNAYKKPDYGFAGDYAGGYDNIAAPPEEPAPDRLNKRTAKAMLGWPHAGNGNTIQYAKEYNKRKSIAEKMLTGKVVIKVYVSRDGFPFCAQVVQPVQPDLDAEALRVALRTRWDPEYKDGLIVPTWQEVTVVF